MIGIVTVPKGTLALKSPATPVKKIAHRVILFMLTLEPLCPSKAPFLYNQL